MKKIMMALLICAFASTAAMAECPCKKRAAEAAAAKAAGVAVEGCPCELTDGVCNCGNH